MQWFSIKRAPIPKMYFIIHPILDDIWWIQGSSNKDSMHNVWNKRNRWNSIGQILHRIFLFGWLLSYEIEDGQGERSPAGVWEQGFLHLGHGGAKIQKESSTVGQVISMFVEKLQRLKLLIIDSDKSKLFDFFYLAQEVWYIWYK